VTILEAVRKAGVESQHDLLGIPGPVTGQCDVIDSLKEDLDMITAKVMELENNLTKAGIRTSLVENETEIIINQVTEAKQTAEHLRQNIISIRSWGLSWRDVGRTLFKTGDIASVVMPKFWGILGVSKKGTN
jgi:hypothetical protein